MSTNILLLCGGDGSEHDISLLSAKFIEEQLKKTPEFSVTKAVIHDHKFIVDENKYGIFLGDNIFSVDGQNIKVDCVVPCIHGIPGETGDIQSFLEIHNIPYIGCKAEASRYCFNKITTKLYLDALGIPNSPYEIIPLQNDTYKAQALAFFDKYQDIYVKAASQGSSVGCYHVTRRDDVWDCIAEAFQFSSEVILEKNIIHRDIKPSNMILQGDRIRLIDFDAARIFKPGQETDTKLLGTKGYAPPEQFGSGQTDSRSDIYALGVTMKILLGGNCGGLTDILDRCTELDPKNRFQNVAELKDALTPEELDDSAPSRRGLISVAINVLWFIIRKNFHAGLFFLTVAIFLSATASTLHRAEFSPEEKISTPQKISVPAEKILPSAQVEMFKLPIISPSKPPAPIESPSRLETLKPPTVTTALPQKKFSGLIKTEFYLNGVAYNQAEHKDDREKISRADWLQSQALLHIVNDTGDIWQTPTIRFVFTPNWGGDKIETTKILPALNGGASTDFIIPFEFYALPDKHPLAVCLQIYLNVDDKQADEQYWAVWFDIVD